MTVVQALSRQVFRCIAADPISAGRRETARIDNGEVRLPQPRIFALGSRILRLPVRYVDDGGYTAG